jgi:hypothetical protein
MQPDCAAGSREVALILACLKARYKPLSSVDLHSIADAELAWPAVLSIARCHGIVPLIHEALLADRQKFPKEIRASLESEFQRSAAGTILYAAELVRLFESFERRGISALAFKGPALAVLLYGRLSLRTVRDLDILVAKDTFDAALSVLHACGYELVSGLAGAPPSVSSGVRKHILLVHRHGGFNVELHWAIADPSFSFPLGFERLWANRQNIPVLTAPIPTLGQEDLVLLMCAHGTSHCWGSLKWICDVAQATMLPGLGWERILTRARALGCTRMLFVSLALARRLCGIEVPEELRPGVASEKVDRLCREIESRLFIDSDPLVNLERTLTFVRSRERFSDRMRIILRFIGSEVKPNARDRSLIRLPRPLTFLYFPFRMVRLMLFCWKRALLPILRSAIDLPRARPLAMLPPE